MANLLGSPKFFCVLEAVIYIANHDGARAVPSAEIAEIQKVSVRYLEADLQRLVHAKLLKSAKGPKGGYTLAKEKRKITAAHIFNALSCSKKECAKVTTPVGDALQQQMNQILIEYLKHQTLTKLCQNTVVSTKNIEQFEI